jgi:hypothetical protein
VPTPVDDDVVPELVDDSVLVAIDELLGKNDPPPRVYSTPIVPAGNPAMILFYTLGVSVRSSGMMPHTVTAQICGAGLPAAPVTETESCAM